MGRLNLKRSSKSSKTSERGRKAISALSKSDRTRSGKPAQKKQVEKKKIQLRHKKTPVKKILVKKTPVKKILVKKTPPISQKGPKLLKRNEIVVFEHAEYKWTGSMWVNIKDNMVAPQYTSAKLNNSYPERENIQKTDNENSPKKAEQL